VRFLARQYRVDAAGRRVAGTVEYADDMVTLEPTRAFWDQV
jgi:hypothetical protein